MEVQLFFDGGSYGRDLCGYGSYLIITPTTRHFSGRRHFGYGMTNNQAEFAALISAAKEIRNRHDARRVRLDVYGDSQIVVMGLDQGWNIKSLSLVDAVAETKRLLDTFASVRYHWIGRSDMVAIFGH
jgi:ribonuclease HI